MATYRNLVECLNIDQEKNLNAIQKIFSIITETPVTRSENVKRWTSEMIDDFNDLVEYTKTSFRGRIASSALVEHVLSLSIFSPDQSKELKEAASVEDVFCALSSHWSFVNYDLLASLIEKHGTEKDHQNLVTFVKEFDLFSECKVSDIPAQQFTTADGDSTLVVKLEHENKELDLHLKHIIQLKRALAKCLKVDASLLQLKSMQGRPVELSSTFLFPKFKAREIFPLPSTKESGLSQCILQCIPHARIASLVCNDYTFKVNSFCLCVTCTCR